MDGVIIRIIDMPTEIAGMTVVDADGNYNVYLNARRGDIKKALVHELSHIRRNDFYTSEHIGRVETIAKKEWER